MAVEVSAAVWRSSRATGNDRLVLLALADHTNGETWLSWPSVRLIAEMCGGINERTVQRCLRRLEEMGEVEMVQDRGAAHRPNVYRVLLMGDDKTPGAARGPHHPLGIRKKENAGSKETAGRRSGSRDRERASKVSRPTPVPLDFPEELKRPLEVVHRVLFDLSRAKGADPPDEGKVAAAMAQYPDRDHVNTAQALLAWMTEGRGQNVPLRSVHQRWRDFLRTAPPAGAVNGRVSSAAAKRGDLMRDLLRAGGEL